MRLARGGVVQCRKYQGTKPGTGQIMTPDSPNEGEPIFAKAIDNIAVVGGFSNHVSMVLKGAQTDEQGALASMIHAKMCAHARSIGAICKSSMFDHSAIMSIARLVLEGMTMFYYLREKVGGDEWTLRFLVLRLHDTAARIKLMRAWKQESEYADLTAARRSMIEQIRSNSAFARFDRKRQDGILTGEEMFVGGMRRAAMRTGVWRDEIFTAIYSYLSVHTHSAPMSFLHTTAQSVDYYAPSDFQYGAAAFAIEVTCACLRRVSLCYLDNHLEKYPEAIKQFPVSILEQFREEDANCGVFT